jgi:hypothetical protein
MTPGLLDLSIVTDRLIQQLNDCVSASNLWREGSGTQFDINYTGLAPDAARKSAGCQVSLYLFHVAADKFYRNTFPLGGSAQQIPEQPLALSLYYLLTAYSPNSYVEEQQAMSIALKCFHEHPIVSATVPTNREEEFTLTLEPQTVDEIGRVWQSISSPMRLSAIYRASVVFLEPPPPTAPKVVLIKPEPVPILISEPVTAVASFTANAAGRVTIAIADAGFVAGETEVQIRALTLQETTTDPPPPGRFRVVDAATLDLQVPAGTPPGRYLLQVRPATGTPSREIWLDVP